jgi:hypothetical protein
VRRLCIFKKPSNRVNLAQELTKVNKPIIEQAPITGPYKNTECRAYGVEDRAVAAL